MLYGWTSPVVAILRWWLRREFDQLAQAAEAGDLDKVLDLLQQQNDNKAHKVYGQTPLHWASANGYETIVRWLLLRHQKQVGVDAMDINQQTPLHWASVCGHAAIVELLLENGADVNAKNIQGDAPLHLASRHTEWYTGYHHLYDGLAHANLYIGDDIKWSTGWDGLAYPYFTIRDGNNNNDDTKIPQATFQVNVDEKGYTKCVQLLLEHGAHVNAQGKWKCTALLEACWRGVEPTVQLLLEHGADVDVQSGFSGRTPLICASTKGYEAIVRMLLEYGADVNVKDKEGKTAVDCATSNNFPACVDALQEPHYDSRATLESAIHQLQHDMELANHSLDPRVIASAMDASRQLERLKLLRTSRQFPTVADLQTQIAEIEAKACLLPVGQEKLDLCLKIEKLKQRLGRELDSQRLLTDLVAKTELLTIGNNGIINPHATRGNRIGIQVKAQPKSDNDVNLLGLEL